MTGYWRHGTDLFVKCKISRQYFSSNFDKRFAIKLSEKVDTFYKRFAKVTFLAPTGTAATVCHCIVLSGSKAASVRFGDSKKCQRDRITLKL